jgi:hypothetical protein
MAVEKFSWPGPKPFTRAPIPPAKRHVDRKKDFKRQEKHRDDPLTK